MAVDAGGDGSLFWRFVFSFAFLILESRFSSFGKSSKDFKTSSLMSIFSSVILGRTLGDFSMLDSLELSGGKFSFVFFNVFFFSFSMVDGRRKLGALVLGVEEVASAYEVFALGWEGLWNGCFKFVSIFLGQSSMQCEVALQ